MRRKHNHIFGTLLGTGAAAATAAFGILARAAADRRTRSVDEAVLDRTDLEHQHPIRRAGRAVHHIGKPYVYIPAAIAIARTLLDQPKPRLRRRRKHRDRMRGAGAVVGSSVLAYGLNRVFDHYLPQPPAPPGHPPGKPVFPSGHTFGPAAIGFTASYLLGRERIASPGATLPAALALPLISAATRMVEKRHWASDVAGGLLGGLAVAGGVLAAFEFTRER